MSTSSELAFKKLQKAFQDMFLYDAVIFRVINKFNRLENNKLKTYRFGFVSGNPFLEYNSEWVSGLSDSDLISHLVFDGVRLLLNHVSGRRTNNDRGVCSVIASNTTLVEMGMGTQFNVPNAKVVFKHLIKGEEYDRLGQLISELDNKIIMDHEFEELYGISADDARATYNKLEKSLYEPEDLDKQNIELYHSLMRSSSTKMQGLINIIDNQPNSSHFSPDSLQEQAQNWDEHQMFNEEVKRIIDHAKHAGTWGTASSMFKEKIIAAYSGKIPFISKLRNWVQKAKLKQSKRIKTSMKFNRRTSEISPDILTAGNKKSGGLKILLAVDTSGSVGTIDLQRGYGIINKFIRANNCELTVIQFDCQIKEIKDIKKTSMTFEITGRGGTCVDEVIKYANTKKEIYSGLIVFTDGDFDKNLPKCELPDLLWVHVSKSDHERNKDTYNQGDVAFF